MAEVLMSHKNMKNQLQNMVNENYEDFVKALVSIETDIEDKNELNHLYGVYMNDDDLEFINEKIIK